jgi:hypothetical protein
MSKNKEDSFDVKKRGSLSDNRGEPPHFGEFAPLFADSESRSNFDDVAWHGVTIPLVLPSLPKLSFDIDRKSDERAGIGGESKTRNYKFKLLDEKTKKELSSIEVTLHKEQGVQEQRAQYSSAELSNDGYGDGEEAKEPEMVPYSVSNAKIRYRGTQDGKEVDISVKSEKVALAIRDMIDSGVFDKNKVTAEECTGVLKVCDLIKHAIEENGFFDKAPNFSPAEENAIVLAAKKVTDSTRGK